MDLFLIALLTLSSTITLARNNNPVATNFTCPEEFGYFPHPEDCSQYYVCVFGGALLESCTGGLMYSHDLQTCDWPRNVLCQGNNTGSSLDGSNTNVRVDTQREVSGQQQQRDNSYDRDYISVRDDQIINQRELENPISVNLRDSLTPTVVQVQSTSPKYTIRFQDDNQADGSRLGRSYEQNVPNYKDELYAVGRGKIRQRRQIHGPHPGVDTMYPPSHWRQRDLTWEDMSYANHHRLYRPVVQPLGRYVPQHQHHIHQNQILQQHQQQQQQEKQQRIQQQRLQQHQQQQNQKNQQNYNQPMIGFHRDIITPHRLTVPKPPPPHIRTTRPPLRIQNSHTHHSHNHHEGDREEESGSVEGSDEENQNENNFRDVMYLDGFQPSTHPMWTTRMPAVLTRDDQSVNGGGKATTGAQQQEIIVDPEYLSQRYAANAPVNVSTGSTASTAQTNLYNYDDSYYVYDDEKEPHYDDVDYKTNQQQQVQQLPVSPPLVPSTTRRPQIVPSTTSTKRPSRGSSRHKSGSGNRPTLKPSSTIVKDVVANVRDVYADPPYRPAPVYETPLPNTPATKCRKDECVLPDCSCGGKEIPANLPVTSVPQIVLLTFDDSVNDLNKDLYRDLFEKGRKNPNGCPISATFYVSHEWTDYSQVQNLAADGHEIASHSVSHSFGEQFSQKKWDKEIGGQREILAAYGGVKLSEVRGMRAPFLAIGGNNMFKMLHDSNFTYDSSMPVYENRPPSWPYTLDHRIFHDCMIPPCPTKSYPGVWEVPMVMWQDLKGGRCSMGDACSNPPTAEGVYNMLAKNFERHYTTNRAPFGLYYHAAWFTQPHHKEGFEAFLDTLVNMDDVFIITNWQAIQWIRDPTPLSRILNFEPWSCHNKRDRPPRCNHPKVCNLWHKSGVRYMKTCQNCPSQYPWVQNTGVLNAI